jgi:hypothetical protein
MPISLCCRQLLRLRRKQARSHVSGNTLSYCVSRAGGVLSALRLVCPLASPLPMRKLLILLFAILPALALASAPVPISWSLGMSPAVYCDAGIAGFNGTLRSVVYDVPTLFGCQSNTAPDDIRSSIYNTASCPAEYYPDFQKLICLPSASPLQLLFTIPESTELGALWSIGFVLPLSAWLVAWCCAQVVSMLRVK